MLNKGLWVDGDSRFVPPGFWSDARNAVIYDEQGNYNLTNEKGYSNFANLPADFTPIGKINFGDGNTILFLSYIGYSTVTPASKIALVDNYGNLSIIFSSDLLNFSPLHQIRGTFYINDYNEREIYWTDGFNPPSYLNIDNFDASTITQEDLSLFYLSVWPQVSLDSVQDGSGQLEAGSYQATIQVLNSDFQPSNYMFVCDPISITNKPTSDINLNSLDNYDYDGAESGLATEKAITFAISNLGGDIAYYNLIIIQSINGVKTYYQTPNIPVSSSLFNTTYQVTNTATLIPTTVSAVTQTYSTYGTANTISQLNNTLILGGLTQTTDIEYQQIANQIKVYYYTEEFNLDSDTVNYKSAYNNPGAMDGESINNDSRSYMKDEVYALAIVWHFDDATSSYAYHIPGRALIPGRDDGTVTDTIYGAGCPTWKAYNTADTEVSGNTNLLAYWQSTELYPNTAEWGSLAGTPVRHHRMPSIAKSPHYRVTRDGSNNVTERIGRILRLNITNINLPTVLLNKITGYSIVRVQRNSSNKSILMQGALFNFTERASGGHVINSFPYSGRTQCVNTYLGSYFGDIKNQFSFFSPEDRFNTVSQVIPDYLSNEYIAYATQNDPAFNNADVHLYSGLIANTSHFLTDPGVVNRPLQVGLAQVTGPITGINIYPLSNGHAQQKRLINTVKQIQANSSVEVLSSPSGVFINNDGGPSFMSIDTSGAGTPYNQLNYPDEVLSGDGVASATTPQFGLTAVPSHAYDITGNPFASGQGVITSTVNTGNWAAYYITNLKKEYSAQYNTLDQLSYMYAGATVFLPTPASIATYAALTSGGINSYTVLNSQGDTFISNFYFRRSVQGDATTFASSTVESGLVNGTKTFIAAINYVPIESTVNVSLRNGGADMNPVDNSMAKSYYPKTGIYSGSPSGTILELPVTVDNFYAYNIDYSAENTVTQYIPKPLNISEENQLLNRIAYSVMRGDEDVFNAYRQFLINNYKDMPREKGNIKDIWVDHNRVYIHLENTLYVISTDELKFGTTEGTVNVGTGAFLEQTPIELKSSEDGYLGLPTAYANILTPKGYFSIDTRRCEAFLFTGEDERISEVGMRSFFLNNAYFSIAQQINGLDSLAKLIPENGWVPNGIGYSCAYDAKYRRILVYKKDYTLVNPGLYNSSTNPSPNQFYYTNGYFYVWSETEGTQGPDSWSTTYMDPFLGLVTIYANLLSLDNTSYFVNNSFTLSYSLDTKSWTSFHDYSPMFMYNSLNFYSVPYVTPGNANHVVLHHSAPYGSFGTVYPFIVEATLNRMGNYGQMNNKSGGSPYVENALLTDSTQGHKQTQSILLDTKCIDNNGVLQIATFDDVIIYNSYQSSGLVPITNRGTSSYVRGIWNINKFRDLVVNYALPFFDSNKNPINVSSSKNYNLKKRFTDNYIVTRFIFNNTNNFKLSLYDITHIFRKVLR